MGSRRDFDELELMMNCMTEDSQWLDSFQQQELKSSTNLLAKKDCSNAEGSSFSDSCFEGSPASFTAHLQGQTHEISTSCESKLFSCKRLSVSDDENSPKRSCNRLDPRMLKNGGPDCHSCAKLPTNPLFVLSAQDAEKLPAPEFVRGGYSNVASETRRLMRAAGVGTSTECPLRTAGVATVEELD